MKFFYLLILCFTVMLLPAFQVNADTYNIANGDVTGLRNAITAANNSRVDDIIVLATNGVYEITASLGIADDYGTPAGGMAFPMLRARDFAGNLTIRGNGAVIRRAANATGKFRFLFCLNNVILNIENLTFRDADADGTGGAIFLGFRNVATFKNVKFINNITSSGIGGAVSSKSLNTTTMEDCEFTGNRVRNIGGAIYHVFSNLTVTNCKFTDNVCTNAAAREGGAAIMVDGANGDNGKISITQSTFSKNIGYAQGGAVYLFLYNTNTATIDRCEFSENRVGRSTDTGLGFGGGLRTGQNAKNSPNDGFNMATAATSITISNSTFFKNTGYDQGGGLWLGSSTVNITNSTIVGNTLENGNGGGIKISGATSTVNMVNCTIAENTTPTGACAGVDNFSGKFSYRNTLFVNNVAVRTGQENYRDASGSSSTDLGNNMVFNTNNSANNGGLANAVVRANPLLSPLADNGGGIRTMALQAGSPAIGAGANCPTTDQRGISRSGRCDIGAFHFNVATVTAPATPANLTAEAQSTTQIRLAWTDNATNETGFKIERSTTAGSGYAEITQVGAGVVNFTDNNLQAGTRYFYRVRAFNAQGNSDYSNEANATTNAPPLLPPAAPTALTAEAQSTTQIRLAWADNATNETGFKIERSTTAGSGYAEITQVGAGVINFTDNNLQAGTRYFYRVRAFNAQGNSDYTNEASTTTSAPTPLPPAAPTALTAEAQSTTQIRLAWADNATNETGFKIERSTTAGSGYTEITQVGAGVVNFTDNNLQASTRYFYRVRAFNAQGNSDYSNEANATTSAPTPLPPAAPTALTAEAQSTTQIRLAWIDNATNETGFKIERSTTAGSGYTEITQVGAGVVNFTDNNLQAGTRYFYRVRAFNAQGNSDYSNEASVIVGITYIDISNQLLVFPNPTEARLSLQIDNQHQGNINVRLLDMVGKTIIKEVWRKYINKLNREIDIHNLPNGVFILEVNYENYRAIKRIIKQ
jgi:hypothetical protein